MADTSKRLEKIHVLQRLHNALNVGSFPSFCLKPLQIKCFEHILNGFDVVAVLNWFWEISFISNSAKFLADQG